MVALSPAARHRGDGDDAAGAPASQMGKGGLDQAPGAFDVDVPHGVEIGLGAGLDIGVEADAGIATTASIPPEAGQGSGDPSCALLASRAS